MENKDKAAFPCINPSYDGNWNKDPIIHGLTKREYFAGVVTQGMLSMLAVTGDKFIVNDKHLHHESFIKEVLELTDELLRHLSNENR